MCGDGCFLDLLWWSFQSIYKYKSLCCISETNMSIISQLKKKKTKTPTTIYSLSRYLGWWGSAEVLTRTSHVAAARQWLVLESPDRLFTYIWWPLGRVAGASAGATSRNTTAQGLFMPPGRPHRTLTGKQQHLSMIPLLKSHSTNSAAGAGRPRFKAREAGQRHPLRP